MRLGRRVNHPPHLWPSLKKEQNCTSTPPLGLHGLLQGDLYLYVRKRSLHRYSNLRCSSVDIVIILKVAKLRDRSLIPNRGNDVHFMQSVHCWGLMAKIYLHVAHKLRMRGFIPPSSHITTWYGTQLTKGNILILYFTATICNFEGGVSTFEIRIPELI